MLSLLFFIIFINVLLKMLSVAVKAAWGISKIIVFIIFLPVMVVCMALTGFISVAFIGLLIMGAISLVGSVLSL